MEASGTTLLLTFVLTRPLAKAPTRQDTAVSVSDVFVPKDVGPGYVPSVSLYTMREVTQKKYFSRLSSLDCFICCYLDNNEIIQIAGLLGRGRRSGTGGTVGGN